MPAHKDDKQSEATHFKVHNVQENKAPGTLPNPPEMEPYEHYQIHPRWKTPEAHPNSCKANAP